MKQGWWLCKLYDYHRLYLHSPEWRYLTEPHYFFFVRLTNCISAEGIVWASWGCHRVLAIQTPGSILDPTLSKSAVGHVVEHSPKVRAFFRISDVAECLQWTHNLMCLSLIFEWNMEAFSLVDNHEMVQEIIVCTLVNEFLLPVVPQPKLCCVITHLRGWYGDGYTTLFRHLPWRMVVITAAFIPEANRFHPNILASLCHLALLQVLSVCYWHLVLGLYWQSKKGASHITKA